jgi:hypothetical protein
MMLAGCRNPDCERAVHRITEIVGAAPKGSEPSAEEQSVIDAVARAMVGKCTSEGLTPEQRDCILAAKTYDDMSKLGSCPAIKAHKPSWLIVPMPDSTSDSRREPSTDDREPRTDGSAGSDRL